MSAAVLTASIATKAQMGFSATVVGLAWWTSRPLVGLAMAVEGLLLGWIVSRVAPRACRWTCAGVFAVLAGVSTTLALQHASSCGCFGSAPIPPIAVAALDALLVAAWLLHRPAVDLPRRRAVAGAIAGVAAVLGAAVALHRPELPPAPAPTTTTAVTTMPTVPDELRHGRWLVVAYREDCDHCRSVFPQWAAAARAARQSLGRRRAFVEISPADVARPGPGLYATAGLPEDIPLVCWPGLAVDALPVALELVDGRVTATFAKPWQVR